MGLSLISIGLRDGRDMSLRALEEARACERLYLELYTMRLDTGVEALSALIGKPVEAISRVGMEDEGEDLLSEAEKSKVGVLVGGDCLAATTHIGLLIEARKRGIPTCVVHGSSVFTAVAETGLSIYKFGRTVTVPFIDKAPPDTVLRSLEENREFGLHTLVLLDLDSEKGRYLLIPEALERLGASGVDAGSLVVGVARLGSGDSVVRADSLEGLVDYDFGEPPHALIFPGRLHFMEEEALRVLAGCPGDVLEGHDPRGEVERLVDKYSRGCRRVMGGMVVGDEPFKVELKEVKGVLDHAARYLDDADYYSDHRRAVALAGVSYAEGVLDCLRLLGLVSFDW